MELIVKKDLISKYDTTKFPEYVQESIGKGFTRNGKKEYGFKYISKINVKNQENRFSLWFLYVIKNDEPYPFSVISTEEYDENYLDLCLI